MYIYARTNTLRPEHLSSGMATVAAAAKRATEVLASPFTAYRYVFGERDGTILVTTRLETEGALATMGQKLRADPVMAASMSQAVMIFEGTFVNEFARIVASNVTGPMAYTAATHFLVAPGKSMEAIEWGAAMQAHATKLTGLAGSCLADRYGASRVRLLATADSLDDLETAQARLAADPTFRKMIESVADLAVPGSSRSALLERIA